MKKIALLSLLALSAGTLTAQQINGTFDGAWETCTPYQGAGSYYTKGVGQQPVGWKASNIYQVSSFTLVEPTTVSEGNTAVVISNKFTGFLGIGQNAPGYLSIGTPWNAARVVRMYPYQATETDGGSFGGTALAFRPDSLKFSFKRSHGTEKPNEVATVAAMLWKGTFTSEVGVGIKMDNTSPTKETMTDRDRDVMGIITDGVTKSEGAECVALINHKIDGNYDKWTTLSLPFTYKSDATPEKINVVFSSSDYFNDDRDAIGAGNSLTIDDVVLVYNSRLASLAYNGTAIEGFDKDNQYYTVTGEYTDDCLTAVSDGAGASVKVSYNAENRIATITVEGNDIASNPENKHEYYVMFAPKTTAYASKLIMGLAGTMLPPATENVGISEISGGKADFLLSNFAFQGMVMGDILLTDVDCQEEADGSITLHKEQTIRVFGDAGNRLGDLPVVLNGTLKDGKLNADLNITWNGLPISVSVYPTATPYVDLTALTGVASQFAAVKDGLTNPNCLFYVTDATLAGDNVIVDTECQKLVLSEDAAFFAPKAFTAAEVSFDRDFAAGRVNTFVLPFTFTVPDGISVTKLNKVEGTTLTFSPVTTAEANTPYLIETNETRPFDALTNVEVAATATVDVTVSGVTHHGAFDSETVTSGETAYYGWNENGEFVKATTGTLLPFRTYLTTSAAQAAPAFKVIMDKPTGIDTITTTETDGAIYDLTGRRVEKAVKGIYIRDGKKVYIK